jgi:hypothetical protein
MLGDYVTSAQFNRAIEGRLRALAGKLELPSNSLHTEWHENLMSPAPRSGGYCVLGEAPNFIAVPIVRLIFDLRDPTLLSALEQRAGMIDSLVKLFMEDLPLTLDVEVGFTSLDGKSLGRAVLGLLKLGSTYLEQEAVNAAVEPSAVINQIMRLIEDCGDNREELRRRLGDLLREHYAPGDILNAGQINQMLNSITALESNVEQLRSEVNVLKANKKPHRHKPGVEP